MDNEPKGSKVRETLKYVHKIHHWHSSEAGLTGSTMCYHRSKDIHGFGHFLKSNSVSLKKSNENPHKKDEFFKFSTENFSFTPMGVQLLGQCTLDPLEHGACV